MISRSPYRPSGAYYGNKHARLSSSTNFEHLLRELDKKCVNDGTVRKRERFAEETFVGATTNRKEIQVAIDISTEVESISIGIKSQGRNTAFRKERTKLMFLVIPTERVIASVWRDRASERGQDMYICTYVTDK